MPLSTPGLPALPSRAALLRAALRAPLWLLTWAVVAVPVAVIVFTHTSEEVQVAGHDAVVEPDLGGALVVRTGPVLPDLRLGTGSVVGAQVRLGKTEVGSLSELAQRYALIASDPDGPRARLGGAVADLALAALVRGAVAGLMLPASWLALGRRRRAELWAGLRAHPRRAVGAVALLGVATVGVWQPWRPAATDTDAWQSLAGFVGPDLAAGLPPELDGVEVSVDVTTRQTRRLVESALDTYRRSQVFYAEAVAAAADLDLRPPEDDETVVVLVSDRHDNIGMDAVARAVGDAAGATGVLDAGDDTSTGSRWETFSLDSLDAAFDGYAGRWSVTGNHDHGTVVGDYLDDLGWQVLDGSVVEGPGGGTLLGVGDPRSSGLGSWRDETGLDYDEVGRRLADEACAHDEPIATVLVHDVDLADEALARGCVDLAVGGHLHVQVGPDLVTGADGHTGWRYTTGTTGGAAYAIALGSKPKRTAQITLLTYRDGRPAGLQAVQLRTDGRFRVGRWHALPLVDAPGQAAPRP